MPVPEFELISQYFDRQQHQRSDVIAGIGDDAAIIQPPEGMELVVAVDTLVEGVHFPLETSPEDIAYKALAVNLSDMAAMGAEPAWFTLALTLPESSSSWLEAFSQGLFELADRYHLQLVGGDTTRGPLSVTIQVAGYAAKGSSLMRSGARCGDQIYVTGTLGDAALALEILHNETQIAKSDGADFIPYIYERLNRPQPRVEQGLLLRELASSCIDISDGLLADLQHITEASEVNKVGAQVYLDKLPLSQAGLKLIEALSGGKYELQLLALNGGDDYELCFTVAAQNVSRMESVMAAQSVTCTHIGEITPDAGQLFCLDKHGKKVTISRQGFQHFGNYTQDE